MVARRGTEFEYRCGERLVSAYVAVPHAGRGPGIVVIHDDWGLNDFARNICDRLARADFVALAPDLFSGKTASRAAEARDLADALDPEEGLRVLDAAVNETLNQHATEGASVGVLGFEVGGQFALALAARNRRIGGVVDFYGRPSNVEIDLGALNAPVLAVFAAEDPSNDASAIDRLSADLRNANVRCSVRTHDGVRPGFMNDTRPDVHDAVAEFECWDALLNFFRAELPFVKP